jgi:hypothetical protein
LGLGSSRSAALWFWVPLLHFLDPPRTQLSHAGSASGILLITSLRFGRPLAGKVANLRVVMGSRQSFHQVRREMVRVNRALRLPPNLRPVRNVRLFVPTGPLEEEMGTPELDLVLRVSLLRGGMIQDQHVLALRMRCGKASPNPSLLQLDLKAGLCPVCNSEMGSLRVDCPHCLTPHHAECWQYFGGCTTYGCLAGPGRTPRYRGQIGLLEEGDLNR